MGRRSVWSDQAVRALVTRFVPVADEVWRLQRARDAESRFFQSFADGAHYRGAGGSRQGIYVVTPKGKLLASANELDPGRLLTMLRESLAKWEGLDATERSHGAPLEATESRRWENSCPEDGLVLIETFRDVPTTFVPGMPALQPSNRDHVWLSAEEARALAHSKPGAESFVRRLARFHLVDAVRGQSLPFAAEELKKAELRMLRDGTQRGGETRFRMRGSTSAVAKGPWLMGPSSWKPGKEYPRSVSVDLEGAAVWDEALGAFTEFELVGIGTRSGHTQVNGRNGDDGPAPIGFHFALSTDGARIPPAYVSVYDADWIVSPAD